jgi:hypothetical protein
MSSDVDIANLALTKLGAQRITALTDDLEQARTMNAIYTLVRDAEIGDHNWSFAAKRAMLAKLTETPVFGYRFLYELPEDCLCVVRVGTSQPGMRRFDYLTRPASDYRLQGRRIETNWDSPLPLLYNSRVTDPTMFDPLFVQALAYRLAMETCEKITQSNTKMQIVAQGYTQAIRRAIKNDSIQEPPDPIPDDSWIMSRL